MKRGVVRGTTTNVLGTTVAMAVGFVTTPIFVHELGAEAYGIYALVLVFTMGGWFGYLDLGLQGAIIREAGAAAEHGEWEQASRIAGSGLRVLAALGLLFGAGLIVAAEPLAGSVFNVPTELAPALRDGLRIAGLVLLVQLPALTLLAGTQMVHRWDLVAIQRTLASLLGTAVALVLVSASGDVRDLIVPVVLAPVLGTVALALMLRRVAPRFRPLRTHPSGTEVRRLLRVGGAFFLGAAGMAVAAQLDQLLIGGLLDARALGVYAIAATPYYAVFSLRAMTNATMLPAGVALRAREDAARLQALFLRATRYAGSLILPAAVTGIVWGSPFIEAWVGPDFHESGVLLAIWLTHFAVTAFTGIGESLYPALGSMRVLVRLSLALALVNLVVSLALVGPFESRGVVAGTVVAYLVIGPLWIRTFLAEIGVEARSFARAAVAPAVAAAAVAAGLGVAMREAANPEGLPLVVVAGAVTFAAALFFAWWRLSPQERTDILMTMRRGAG